MKWFYAVRVWLEELARRGTNEVLVVRMRADSKRGRKRDLADGKVKVQQGRSSKRDPEAYKGDAFVRDPKLVTLQVHELYVTEDGEPDIDDVVALAVHIPAELSAVVVQPTGAH